MRIRKLILFVVICSFPTKGIGQKIIDSLSVYDYPVKEGVIYKYDLPICYGDLSSIVTIYTSDDSVLCFEDARVVSVFSVGEYYAVVFLNKRDEFITYSNLESTKLKKGDFVKRGDHAGLAFKSDYDNKKSVDIIIFEGTNELQYAKCVEYIRYNMSGIGNPKAYTVYATPSKASSVFGKTSLASISNSSSVSYLLLK